VSKSLGVRKEKKERLTKPVMEKDLGFFGSGCKLGIIRGEGKKWEGLWICVWVGFG